MQRIQKSEMNEALKKMMLKKATGQMVYLLRYGDA